jgi:hypothetical protein
MFKSNTNLGIWLRIRTKYSSYKTLLRCSFLQGVYFKLRVRNILTLSLLVPTVQDGARRKKKNGTLRGEQTSHRN